MQGACLGCPPEKVAAPVRKGLPWSHDRGSGVPGRLVHRYAATAIRFDKTYRK